MNTDLRVIFTTFPGMDKAREVVRELVKNGLIACGNLLPGPVSLYIYEGQFCEDEEVVAILKSRESKLPELRTKLRELHPYQLPEFLVLPVGLASTDYAQWVRDQTPENRGN